MSGTGVEYPDADKLRIYGDFAFLAFRSPRHQGMALGLLRESFEPPIELGQFRIFRFDGIPRGLVTWARLNLDAERDYLERGRLDPNAWASGDRLWIIDLIAPYRGLAHGMGRWLRKPGNFTDREFRYRRMDGQDRTRRIVHVDFHRPEGTARIWRDADACRASLSPSGAGSAPRGVSAAARSTG